MSESRKYNAIQRRSVFLAATAVLVFVLVAAILEIGNIDSTGLVNRHLLARMRTADTVFTWSMAPPLVALGVAVGLAGGLLGMGGGALLVAGLLLLFRLDVFFVRAISLEVVCLLSASAAIRHTMDGWEPRAIAWPMVTPAIAGVLGGVGIGLALRGSVLTHLFGFFMLFLGFFTLAQLVADPVEDLLKREHRRPTPERPSLVRGLGALHGFLCGLLGISGGVITIPLQQMLLRAPARHAIAVSLFVSAIATGVGSIVATAAGVHRGDFELGPILTVATLLGVGAAVGAQLGARLCGRINSAVLRGLFVAVSFAAGLAILL